MPGSSSSCLSSSRETASGQAPIVSDAFRYARILNAFSPLISSRSAISANTRAIGWLSTCEAVALDPIVEHARTAGVERGGDRGAPGRRPVAEETAAAARAAYLGRRGASPPGAGNQILDDRRRHARCEALPVLPFLGNGAAHRVPVFDGKRGAHARRRVPDTLEAVEDVAVAVDVLLHDLPIVRAGVPRLARIAEHDSAFKLARVDVERHAPHAVDIHLDRGDAAVHRGAVVLQPRGNVDGLRLDVHRNLQQRLGLVMMTRPLGERG